MTTKAELREQVRRRLEDISIAPLWDDVTLDDALADGLIRYSAIAPQEERSSVTVASGASAFAVAGLEAGAAIRQVLAPGEVWVPPALASTFEEPGQAWRWWAGQIRLARPANGGSWTVEWHRPRLLPGADSGAMPVQAGDEGAVSLFAAASALRRRAVEEAKRGGRGTDGLIALANEWDATAERQARARGRQVRSFVALER